MTTVLDGPVPTSFAERYAAATPAEREQALRALDPDQHYQLATSRPWWWWGRSDQQPPPGDWRWWAILAGRGWGKTRTGGESITGWARRFPGSRHALVGPTYTDGRDTMVEGESGILSHTDFTQLRGGSIDSGWNRSLGELFFANGSRCKVFTSEQPWRLRGPQHHFCWGDEPSYWRDAAAGTAKDSTFSNLNIGLRLPALPGWPEYRPQGVLTMTPRLVPLLKVPEQVVREDRARAGLLQRDDVTVTRGTTMANLRNLDPTYYNAVIAPLIGTTLGLQELGGVLLEEVQGALWTLAGIELDRVAEAPDELDKILVSFDPAGGDTRDEHGIVVAGSRGTASRLHGYVLADMSLNATTSVAAQIVIGAAFTYGAAEIVYEKNQGQGWIPSTIELTYATMRQDEEWDALLGDWKLPPLVAVTAAKAKEVRAVPVQMMSQQHRWHMVGRHPILESQLSTWVPGETDSPDRLDAMVWAGLRLLGSAHGETAVASPASRERRGRRANQPSSQLPAVYGLAGRR